MGHFQFKQLIDLAIGSPEPGHVNFYALHCLLYSFADKLNIIDQIVDFEKFGDENYFLKKMDEIEENSKLIRLEGGAEDNVDMKNNLEEENINKEEEENKENDGQIVGPFQKDPTFLITNQPSMSLNKFESNVKASPDNFPQEIEKGIYIMKAQLDLAMEQLYVLTESVLENQIPASKIDYLRKLAGKLRSIQKDNIFIKGTDGYELLKWEESDRIIEEVEEEDMSIISLISKKESDITEPGESKRDTLDLEVHLCFSKDKILDEIMELKAEFCFITNKINEISAIILQQDCQRTMLTLQELQDQVRDLKFNFSVLRDSQEKLELTQTRKDHVIEKMDKAIIDLKEEKIDKSENEILLAKKVDYCQLHRKVSQEQLKALQCRIERQFCEMNKLIRDYERNILQIAEDLKNAIGPDAINIVLSAFKEKIDEDVKQLKDKIGKYIDATDNDCVAAGGRMKTLQDLVCISCNTTCTMKTMEKAKVPNMPNAYATGTMGAVVAYELNTLRKNDVPLNRLQNKTRFQNCVTRHAGGPHTSYTAKEKVEKVFMQKK